MDWYARARELAPQYGLDPSLVEAVMGQESGGKQNRVSSAGAIGLMQLMPGTAADLGVNPQDPEQNLRGGLTYLKQQLDTFGSVPLALAAYNAGPGRVKSAGGIPAIAETQNYVKRIMAKLGQGGSTPPTITSALPPGGGMPAQAPEATQMPQGTLPPEFSPPEPTTLSNMAQNPWLQMGLGILASNNVGEGMQKGLLGAAAAEQTRERNRLWQQQINQAQASQMGMGRANEAERMRNTLGNRVQDIKEAALKYKMSGGGATLPQKAQMIEYLIANGRTREEATKEVMLGGAGGQKAATEQAASEAGMAELGNLYNLVMSDATLSGPAGALRLGTEKGLGYVDGMVQLFTGVNPDLAGMTEGEKVQEIKVGGGRVIANTAKNIINAGEGGRLSDADREAAKSLSGFTWGDTQAVNAQALRSIAGADWRLMLVKKGVPRNEIYGPGDAPTLLGTPPFLRPGAEEASGGSLPPETSEGLPSSAGTPKLELIDGAWQAVP